jgi:hypothetical protein
LAVVTKFQQHFNLSLYIVEHNFEAKCNGLTKITVNKVGMSENSNKSRNMVWSILQEVDILLLYGSWKVKCQKLKLGLLIFIIFIILVIDFY